MERAALVLLAACWTGSDARPAAPGATPRRAGPPLEIALERRPCLGTCPVYRIEIHADGRVDWLGGEHVAAAGARARRIAPADLDALDRELAAARFFERDRFGRIPTGPTCVTQGTITTCSFRSEMICGDTSPTLLVVRRGGRTHRIQNDHCSDEDPALAELERRILERAGAAAWIGR